MCAVSVGITQAVLHQSERYILTDNGRLFARTTGAGAALLMIHGVASDARYFDGAIPLLSRQFQVITYDRNGNSRSIPFLQADFSPQAEARDGWSLLDALDIRQSILVGVSGGCRIALEMALLRPEQVRQVILYEPPFCVTEASQRAQALWTAKVAELVKDGDTAGAMLAFVDMIGGIDDDSPGISTQQQMANFRNFCFFLKHQLLQTSSIANCREQLSRLSVPCCVMAGSRDRGGLFRQTAIETARLLKTPPVFSPGYHNYPKDHPRQFAEQILALAL